MNKLLQNQIKTFLGDDKNLSPEIISFLKEISNTYSRFEYESSSTTQTVSELEKANHELDQFAYIVSHDLKAPLRAISSISNWIEEDLGNSINDETKENFQQLKARVQRMENLIEGILNYSKASKTTTIETVNINNIINDILFSINAKENIQVSCNASVSDFFTEKIKLEQVFLNLITNAIKYNDKTTCQITIDVFDLDDTIQCTVRDNGPGIDSKYHKKIFQIFQTLNSRDTIESTGIGLSIVKKIVEEQGGKIWVESNPGKGTSFVFTWPKTNQANKETIKSNQQNNE